jgi:hypothetical protein
MFGPSLPENTRGEKPPKIGEAGRRSKEEEEEKEEAR